MQKRLLSSALTGALLLSSTAMAAPSVSVAQLSRDNIAAGRDLPPAVSSNDPAPVAPSPLIGRQFQLIRQAGRGGPTAYARGGVMELGGALMYQGGTNYQQLTVSPSVGLFLTNNFQLSAIASLGYSKTVKKVGTDSTTTEPLRFFALIEPSFHIPLADQLFVFAGVGVGVAYHKNFKGNPTEKNAGTGFALAPRVGLNIMVGRSGILTPSFNVNYNTNKVSFTNSGDAVVSVATTYGASFGYSVMF